MPPLTPYSGNTSGPSFVYTFTMSNPDHALNNGGGGKLRFQDLSFMDRLLETHILGFNGGGLESISRGRQRNWLSISSHAVDSKRSRRSTDALHEPSVDGMAAAHPLVSIRLAAGETLSETRV